MSRETGDNYERVAESFLSEHGHRIIERNFKLANAEIDLITHDGDFFVFFEIKYRRSATFAQVLEQITQAQLNRVKYAARVWIYQKGLIEHETACRFDVIAITGIPYQFEWLKDAF